MRVAVVGNGPSAAGRGAEIDAHDFVVRCAGFTVTGADGAGRRLDAWARFASPYIFKLMGGRLPEGSYEVWMTKPLSFWGRSDKVDPEMLIRQSAGRPIRWITSENVIEEADFLRAEPTTGFTAVDMAIRYLRPAEVTLYGFDATTPAAPGWGDAKYLAPGWNAAYPHDFPAEKVAFAELRDRGVWLGQPCGVRLSWRRLEQ